MPRSPYSSGLQGPPSLSRRLTLREQFKSVSRSGSSANFGNFGMGADSAGAGRVLDKLLSTAGESTGARGESMVKRGEIKK
eukprot:1183192-Prorocentrum_minimum.AAC.3